MDDFDSIIKEAERLVVARVLLRPISDPTTTMTAGEGRRILSAAVDRGLVGMSKLNPSLTRQQAHDIFVAALSLRADESPVPSLMAKNIQREFA